MTEKAPEHLATADLTPVSPAPLHPSSPVVVPSLQDQADTLCTMSLSSGALDPSISVAAVGRAEATDQNTLPASASQNYDNSSETATSRRDSLADEIDGTGKQPGGAELLNERYAHRPSPSQQNDIEHQQEDMSNMIESSISSVTSDSLTNGSEVGASSYDLSSPSRAQSVHQSVHQSATNPSPSGAQEPQKPQDQAVINLSTKDPDVPQPPSAAPAEEDRPSNAANDRLDIQNLVDKIIGNASVGDASQTAAPQSSANIPAPPQAVSLPPRPPMPQLPAQPYVHPDDSLNYQSGLSYHNANTLSSLSPPPGAYSARAPGTALESHNNLPPSPASALNALSSYLFPVSQFNHPSAVSTGPPSQASDQHQRWESFLQEERRYVSEAKWDRFPEGSRLFIGNLSSDRVSKKEVFDIFCKYGRLAQISLKQAYGFVQYHTLAEGQAAMDHLQGIEVKGRKIHLEFSRSQKKDGDGEKRGTKIKKENERHDSGRGRRDDYRPSRQLSPRIGSHRQQSSFDSSRGYYDDYNARARSRSPGHGRRDSNHYRRRSPSPYHRHPSEVELDIPRRYGGDIPDVQFLLLQGVERNFVSWAERAFLNQGLRVQVMFLHPHFPREAVIQRQVMEGVHAVVELDFRAQQTGLISLQVFNRGRDNVQYDQYQDLDPNIAAQLVSRAKSQVQSHNPYSAQYPPAQYAQAPHPQPSYIPPPYAAQPYPTAGAPTGNPSGPLDNATLQKILGSLHNQQGVPQSHHPAGGAPVDVNSVLASLGGDRHICAAGPSQPHNLGYPPVPPSGAPGGDSSQHVQNIMAQLARYRQ
ncbi:uncharacterized protein F4812DRAFT_320364 [Daldinia caldariorum]|uniref:uncharacterized protein n=1 Tax=Daldinia caldariorum TaxID=326644 RepID=UPI00200788E2|nr:uncharacterized protein F4812DRAFT_320364 [Daldinia caldariorum]KAI1469144.1 hypothetical protein F4812DRAFT_320364 [Daldinia caldariorum]